MKYSLILVLALFITGSAYCLRIDNARVHINLDQGKTYAGTVTVENPTTEKVSVRMYLEDFVYVAPFDGEKEFFPPGTTEYSLSDWLSLSPVEFELDPLEKQAVNFTIRPDRPVDKVHCGVLFSETDIGGDPADQGGVEIRGRLGTLIFVEPEQLKESVLFDDVVADSNRLSAKISNNGNTFLYLKGSYFVFNEQDEVLDRNQLKEVYLLPKDRTDVSIDLSGLLIGSYTMVLTFDMGFGTAKVSEIDFLVSSDGGITVTNVRN
ncbi:MAG: hypothetical protein PHV17_07495 [Candidatus Omnitrophica bacterium]|nr:hypothetical protein [Candidatus Omnitrophota bacterium]